MYPAASLDLVLNESYNVDHVNKFAFDPLVDWIRVDVCKDKGNQCSTMDTPTTVHWLVFFPNVEETRRDNVRLNSIFSTICL